MAACSKLGASQEEGSLDLTSVRLIPAGLGSQEVQEHEAAQVERQQSGALAGPSGDDDLPPAGTRQPQGVRREAQPETVRRGAHVQGQHCLCYE